MQFIFFKMKKRQCSKSKCKYIMLTHERELSCFMAKKMADFFFLKSAFSKISIFTIFFCLYKNSFVFFSFQYDNSKLNFLKAVFMMLSWIKIDVHFFYIHNTFTLCKTDNKGFFFIKRLSSSVSITQIHKSLQ